MAKIKFTKMNGLGNDFVVLDYVEYQKSGMEKAELAAKLCDRHFGIGADGLMIIHENPDNADIGWYFYNSDGSVAQMCGNGMRCFAKYVYDNKLVIYLYSPVRIIAIRKKFKNVYPSPLNGIGYNIEEIYVDK